MNLNRCFSPITNRNLKGRPGITLASPLSRFKPNGRLPIQPPALKSNVDRLFHFFAGCKQRGDRGISRNIKPFATPLPTSKRPLNRTLNGDCGLFRDSPCTAGNAGDVKVLQVVLVAGLEVVPPYPRIVRPSDLDANDSTVSNHTEQIEIVRPRMF